MEVRLNIDDAFWENIQDKVGSSIKATDITRDALTMFNWAVTEVASGRVVLSTNSKGQEVRRLVMPTLTQVETTAKRQVA